MSRKLPKTALQVVQEWRQKHFAVKIEPATFPAFDDEIVVSVTYNGRQWTALSLTKQEAAEVIAALKQHFGLN